MTKTRGESNNNPGNIREYAGDGTAWKGERATDDDSEFEEFKRPEDGIRALGKVLLSYYRRRHLNTVRGIINRWAPTNENDTTSYVNHVANKLHVGEHAALNLEDPEILEALIRAIIVHENGRNIYDDATIVKGVDSALA